MYNLKRKRTMKKTVLMSFLMVLCLSACSKEEKEVGLLNSPAWSDYNNSINYMSEKEFKNFVEDKFFEHYSYVLSNDKPKNKASLRFEPVQISSDKSNKWINYYPTSFWFDNNELYCSAQFDFETYERWMRYSTKNKIELFVHSPYTYDEADGRIITEKQIIPAEKANNICHLAMNWGSGMYTQLVIKLVEPLGGNLWNSSYDYMYINYNRELRSNISYNILKIFNTNEEAVAYAKELMGI
jgi:hypothetical protein